MKILNYLNCIYDRKVNNKAECYLLHNVLKTSKLAKNINSHNYPILHGCMNTCRCRARYNMFRILLDSGCISIIVTRSQKKT